MISLEDNILLSDEYNEEGCFGESSISTYVFMIGLFKNIFLNLKKGSYLIRLRKKPLKHSQSS